MSHIVCECPMSLLMLMSLLFLAVFGTLAPLYVILSLLTQQGLLDPQDHLLCDTFAALFLRT